MDAVAVARKLGWPLTAQDIIQERVEFEDRILHRHIAVERDPDVMRKELPPQTWSPAASHAFGNGIMRFAISLLP
jgi:hypothetical protein